MTEKAISLEALVGAGRLMIDTPRKLIYTYAHKGVQNEKIGERDFGRRTLGALPYPGDPGKDIGLGDLRALDGGVSR